MRTGSVEIQTRSENCKTKAIHTPDMSSLVPQVLLYLERAEATSVAKSYPAAASIDFTVPLKSLILTIKKRIVSSTPQTDALHLQ